MTSSSPSLSQRLLIDNDNGETATTGGRRRRCMDASVAHNEYNFTRILHLFFSLNPEWPLSVMKLLRHRPIIISLVVLILMILLPFRESEALTTTTQQQQNHHFQIRHQFDALSKPKKGVLSIVPLPPSYNNVLIAVAGHDGGYLNIWDLSSDNDDDEKRQPPRRISANRIHQGSIFTLHVVRSGELEESSVDLISGSFDRSSSLHRLIIKREEENNNNELPSSPPEKVVEVQDLGKLPEHTGWVRQVKGISSMEEEDRDFYLSIGCNLINVWTSVDDVDCGTRTTKRIARLDAGPSPDDPKEETFRRHDILCLDVLEDDGNDKQQQKFIVAGLVDGSVRLFDVTPKKWNILGENDNAHTPLDVTGSCRPFENYDDEKPLFSFYAHKKGSRVCNIHSIPSDNNDDDDIHFLTVGYDGQWIVWKVDNKESSQKIDGVEIVCSGNSGENHGRIVCSCVVRDAKKSAISDDISDNDALFFFATLDGKIFQVKGISSSSPSESMVLRQEPVFDLKKATTTLNDDGKDNENQSITCLSAIPTGDGTAVELIVGLSTGEVLILVDDSKI